MNLYGKVWQILQTETFNRKRYLAASKLYAKAKGEERKRIGELFESQINLIKTPEDLKWAAKVDQTYSG